MRPLTFTYFRPDSHFDEVVDGLRERVSELNLIADAGGIWSELFVEPETWLTVAFLWDGRGYLPAAFTAVRREKLGGQPIFRVFLNYEVRELRGRGAFEAAHLAQRREVLGSVGATAREIPAVTDIYPDPLPVFMGSGWTMRTGVWQRNPNGKWSIRMVLGALRVDIPTDDGTLDP